MAHLRNAIKAFFLGLVGRKKGCKHGRSRKSRGKGSKIVDEHGLVGAHGSLGPIYRGKLEDRTEIVVRRLEGVRTKPVGEFCVAVNSLAQISHQNLLSIRGFCVEEGERMLVYDLMANGSLYAHLHGGRAHEEPLTWERRMSIALGAAQGLEHLHHHADPSIVHGGLKSSNILLDSSYQARVTEFGFDKLFEDGGTTVRLSCSDYLAPELLNGAQILSKQADVFSFGVLLLELVSGRRPVDPLGSDPKQTLIKWAQPFIEAGHLGGLVDPRLGQTFVLEDLQKVAGVAISCVSSKLEDRPNMAEVVRRLRV